MSNLLIEKSWSEIQSPFIQKNIQGILKHSKSGRYKSVRLKNNKKNKKWESCATILPKIKNRNGSLTSRNYRSSSLRKPYFFSQRSDLSEKKLKSFKIQKMKTEPSYPLTHEEMSHIYGADEWVDNVKYGKIKFSF